MPTNFLNADAGFPRLTPEMPVEERLNRIQNYLFMLLEQLRYTLANLGEENFNDESLKEIGEAIQGPVLSIVTDLEGNVSTLEQTATSISARLDDVDGNHTSLEVFATGIEADMYGENGKVNTIKATADGVSIDMYDPAGKVAGIEATADKIYFLVDETGGQTATTFQMTANAIDAIAQGINITGYVTFSSLETAGQSVINGDNIELKADADGDSVSYLTYTSVNGNTFAQIHTRDNQQASTLNTDRYAFVIETPQVVDGDYCAMKLIAGDSMSLEAGWQLFMKATSQIVLNNGLLATRIQANNVQYVSGDSNYPSDCYIFASDGIYYGGQKILST